MKKFTVVILCCLVVVGLAACWNNSDAKPPAEQPKPAEKPAAPQPSGPAPVFSLAWSEYPSWSTFGVADAVGLIKGARGEQGPIEKKYGVDIELKEAEYDPCLQMYGAGQTDAVCITNMDVLQPSLSRKSVAVTATSTSYGADACIVARATVADVRALRGKPVYGLQKSVSEYAFVRGLEILGENPADYTFTNMDPGAAAVAMQQRQEGYDAIMVWNPFVQETLNRRSDTRVLFDSRSIPSEILDMLVVAEEALARPGGDAFAAAALETFYAVNKRIADPKTRDDTIVALGEKFSNLNLASMKVCLQQTRFFETPDQALALFTGGTAFPGGTVETQGNLVAIMERVVAFCVKYDITSDTPRVGYGTKAESRESHLRFDPTYLKRVAAGKP